MAICMRVEFGSAMKQLQLCIVMFLTKIITPNSLCIYFVRFEVQNGNKIKYAVLTYYVKKSTHILKVVISDVIPNARSRCPYDVKFFSLRCASRNRFCRVAFIILSIILKGMISFFSQSGMRLKKESKRVLKFRRCNALN